MGACKDPALTLLNNDGYNVVRLPRAGIEPLDVLGRDGKSLEKLGSITEVWTSTAPAPQPGPPQPAASVNGQRTQGIDLGIGLQFLSNALAGMGSALGLPSLQSSYKNAHSVEFDFVNVTSIGVTPFGLGKFLANGTLDVSNPAVTQYFGNEETKEYIIIEVLKSDTISVTAKGESGGEVQLDLPAIQGLVGANIKVKAGSTSAGQVVYQGPSVLTFGFKVFEVMFDNGKWRMQGKQASADLSFAANAGADDLSARPILLAPAGLVRLR